MEIVQGGMDSGKGRLWRVKSRQGALWSVTGQEASLKMQGAGIDTRQTTGEIKPYTFIRPRKRKGRCWPRGPLVYANTPC